MCYFAMDLRWKRVPMLLILLIFWKHAFGMKGWSSHDVPPHQKWHANKITSPPGAQSSVFETPVTGSIPFEEVASNVLAGKSLNPSRSRFSHSRQYVKGGISGSHASMSHTQSAPSSSVSASLVLPQNLPSLYSNPSLLKRQDSFSPSVRYIASHSGLQFEETSSPLSAPSSSSTGSSASSLSEFIYTSQDSSRPQLAGSSSQLASTDGVSGLLPQSQSTASQISGSSMSSRLAASPLSVIQSTSGQSSHSQYTSGSQRMVGTKLVASRQSVPKLQSSYGSSFQPQGAISQYAPNFSLGGKVPVSSQYYPATQSGSSRSLSQSSQKWQPSTSRTQVFQSSRPAVFQGFQTSGASQSVSQYPGSFVSLSMSQPSQLKPSILRLSQGFQASGTVASQSKSQFQGSKSPSRPSTSTSAASPGQSFSNVYTSSSTSRAGAQLAGSSRYVPMQMGSTSSDGSSLRLQGTSSQNAPALVAKVAPNKLASRGSSSLSQPSQLQPPSYWWHLGFQAPGTVASQSGSPSHGSKSPSRSSTFTSAASPGQSFSNVYTSSSTSRAGAHLAGSSRYVPMQTGSTSSDGSSLRLQGTSSQFSPALVAKVPPYKLAASSGSSSLGQPSQLQPPISRWSQGFQATGTVASHSGSPSHGSKSLSRFSTLTTAASPEKLLSTQDGSGRYRGLFGQSQRTSSQYAPAPLDAKVYSQAAPSVISLSMNKPSQWQPSTSRWSQGFQASGTVASQSGSLSHGSKSPSRFSTLTSAASPGQSFSNVLTSSSQSRAGAQLAGSSRYVPMQTGSTSDGSSLQLQGISSQYAPALVAKVAPYKLAASSGSSSLSKPSQLQPPTSRWSQGLLASGTVASQSGSLSLASQTGSLSHGSKSPSRFSTLTSAASPGQSFSNILTSRSQSRAGAQLAGSSRYVPMQTGSTSSDGSSLQLQGTSSQFAPALVAKVPLYKPAASSGSSSLSQPSQLQPPISRWSQGLQASGTVASQTGSLSHGSKSPSRFSTLTSAASPGQSFSNLLTSSSQSRAGAQLAGSSRYVPMQMGSTSTDGSSLQLQGTSSHFAPALVAKVPPYKPAASSGSSSLSKPSQLQPPISRWSQGLQASGTVASQSSFSSQGLKSPWSFSTLTSAASPDSFFTQDGSGRHSSLSSQSQSASGQYNPVDSSTYGQKPSKSSPTSRRYSSSVKG
ncbi:mucin-19 [Pimephales promelas]|uniref:mucin-19 n=1 Tax=Pimephales promelas TaxID=90988 RepID=UPI001955DEF0|nr:mucin-19 [Pimephales promelas]KAG1955270.1 hypothetical protein F2P79_009122 [Pimephales promelas]